MNTNYRCSNTFGHVVYDHALLMSSLLGGTYICEQPEQVFSRKKNTKCKSITRINDNNLECSISVHQFTKY